MMRRRYLQLLILAVLEGATCSFANAQMFAPVTNQQATSGAFPGGSGPTLSGSVPNSLMPNNTNSFGTNSKGAVNPNSRFVRTGRNPADFVGTDSTDRRRFVGSIQAAARRARLQQALQLRPETNPNQTPAQAESNSATSLYPPRLVLDPDLPIIEPAEVGSVLERRLANSPAIHSLGPLQVSIENRTAILRGTVASTKERVLAGLLAELEPGVSHVQNDLQVKPPAEPIALPPQAEPPDSQSPSP